MRILSLIVIVCCGCVCGCSQCSVGLSGGDLYSENYFKVGRSGQGKGKFYCLGFNVFCLSVLYCDNIHVVA